MTTINCQECGCGIDWHTASGCQEDDRADTRKACTCTQTPRSIAARAVEEANNSSFFGGVSTALGVLKQYDEPTIYDDIINTMNAKSIQMFIDHLKANDEMEFSGMDDYIERHADDTAQAEDGSDTSLADAQTVCGVCNDRRYVYDHNGNMQGCPDCNDETIQTKPKLPKAVSWNEAMHGREQDFNKRYYNNPDGKPEFKYGGNS